MTLGSDAGSLRHPQRRTEDFTNPFATVEVYFLQWPDRSILSRILKSFCGVGDRTDLESDARLLRHPQRSEVNSVNSSATTEVKSVNLSATVGWETSAIRPQRRTLTSSPLPQRRTGDHSHLRFPILRQKKICPFCGVGNRTDLESDARSLRHPQRRMERSLSHPQ